MKTFFSFVLILLCTTTIFATPMRIAIIRGGYVSYYYGGWEHVADSSVTRLQMLLESHDNIDIVLFPEFAFGGIDGGTTGERPEVFFEYDPLNGFVPYPWDSLNPYDVRTADRIDTLRFIAEDNNIYIWASSCCERIEGHTSSFNSIPLISPDGKIYRIRRKTWYSTHETARDTTVHLDTIATRSGKRVAVMTTICYENGCLPWLLEPTEPPAPLWLLPHGTWLLHFENVTAATQRWQYCEIMPELDSFSEDWLWGIISDGWVRDDAVMLSCDIFTDSYGALAIDNVHRDNVAWEPLAWIAIEDEYVIVDCNVPAVDEIETLTKAPKKAPVPVANHLEAYPKITTGPVFLCGANGNIIKVFDEAGELVSEIAAQNGKAIWDAAAMENKPIPGEYSFDDGFSTTTVTLIK